MKTQARLDAEAHALAEYPRESCGLVVVRPDGTREYVPCRNTATTPSSHFVLPGEDYATAEMRGEVVQLVHSHPKQTARASEGDLVSCENSGLEWLILSIMPDETGEPRAVADSIIRPHGYEAPLIGREFSFGVLDCFTLVRDWYRIEKEIILPDFERQDGFWVGPDAHELYLDNFAKAGFAEVPLPVTLEVGDVLLMKIHSKVVTNHAGIYVGDGKFLHHVYGRLSRVDVYGGQWFEKTRMVVRRKA